MLERVITILVDIRYHLSSLVAVFLSLGLGMVIGMSLAEDDTLRREQQHLIRSIEDRVALVQKENSGLRAQLSEVQVSLGDYERLLWETGGRLFGQALGGVRVTVISESTLSEFTEPWTEFLRVHGSEVRYLAWDSDRLSETGDGAEGIAATIADLYATVGSTMVSIVWSEAGENAALQTFVSEGVLTAHGFTDSSGMPDVVVFVPDTVGLFSAELDAALQQYKTQGILALTNGVEPAVGQGETQADRWAVVSGADTHLGWFHVIEAIASAVEETKSADLGRGDHP